jgi:hypothetical protein
LLRIWGHFKTITRHKFVVMRHCFRVGLYRQGLLHDLSKYSWTEFRVGAKYFTGKHSPNVEERNELGYSTAWLHHKGRNKHHFEYWNDFSPKENANVPIEMPTKYFVEMVMDRIAACKIYNGKEYYDGSALDYLHRGKDMSLMHPRTLAQLEYVLVMLRDKGEGETFDYLKHHVLKGEAIPVKSDVEP